MLTSALSTTPSVNPLWSNRNRVLITKALSHSKWASSVDVFSQPFLLTQRVISACLHVCHDDPGVIWCQVENCYHNTGRHWLFSLCNQGQQQRGATPLCHCRWTPTESSSRHCSEVRREDDGYLRCFPALMLPGDKHNNIKLFLYFLVVSYKIFAFKFHITYLWL